MFTQTSTRTLAQSLRKRVLGSDLVDLLTGPHGVDRYTELVAPTWTIGEARAKVVDVRRTTPRSVTLTLAPNESFTSAYTVKAGQYVNLTVDIDGRRHTRCYSPANAEGGPNLELTIGHHDGGLVSTYLYERARRGMVVGLAGVGGDFVLPRASGRGESCSSPAEAASRPSWRCCARWSPRATAGEIAFVHYARSPQEACYRDELADTARRVRVLHGYTRSGAGDLVGSLRAAASGCRDAVARRGVRLRANNFGRGGPAALRERATPRASCRRSFEPPANPSGGRITFADSGIDVIDDGRSLLEQAESAGLTPQNGCRMGICHTCTRRKTAGTVRNLTTGSVSTGAGRGRADLRVRPGRRRRAIALVPPDLEGKAMSQQQDHPHPRAGRRIRPRARRHQRTRGGRPRREGRRLHPPRHQSPARAGSGRARPVVPAPGLAAGYRDAGRRRKSWTTWRSATTSCTVSTTGCVTRRSPADPSSGTPLAPPISGGIRTTTCTTPTPTSWAWTATSATASCG